MDNHSPEQRSYNMSKVKGKDTLPELTVRKWLWANGYRYRLHKKSLPGKPDIVLLKYKAVIFVHGCYWHRHGCKYSSTPATREEFWNTKFEKNVRRDIDNIDRLNDMGWRVLVLWGCEIKKWNSDLEFKIKDFLRFYPTIDANHSKK